MNGNPYVPEGMNQSERIGWISRRELECAMAEGRILEAVATLCDCRTMELQVDLGDIRGVIPKDEVTFSPTGEPVKDIAVITRVGKPVRFRVMGLREDSRGTIALLSRREAQRECYEHYIKALHEGDILPARITHLEPFGAFCDIGCGLVALLTVDCISVSRISHPGDRFEVGQVIPAIVRQIDHDTGRVYLTHRELLGTWEENAALFRAGQTVTGIVRSVEDYGVFVELTPNLAGLAEYTDEVAPGDLCSVYIKSILPERMKVKLVLIEVCGAALPRPMRYFVDTGAVTRLDHWLYSPKGCGKRVETVFQSAVLPRLV